MAQAKDVTLISADGGTIYYPHTEASLVKDSETGKTVKEQIDTLGQEIDSLDMVDTGSITEDVEYIDLKVGYWDGVNSNKSTSTLFKRTDYISVNGGDVIKAEGDLIRYVWAEQNGENIPSAGFNDYATGATEYVVPASIDRIVVSARAALTKVIKRTILESKKAPRMSVDNAHRIGNLSLLNTINKDNLVDAINEAHALSSGIVERVNDVAETSQRAIQAAEEVSHELTEWRDALDVFVAQNKQWIRYSDGVRNSSTNSNLYTYILRNVDILGCLKIRINTGYSDTASAAIAFYSENESLEIGVAPSSYMADESIISKRNLPDEIYEAMIPRGCKMIAITNKKDVVANPTIMLQYSKLRTYDGEIAGMRDSLEYVNQKTLPAFYHDFLFGNMPVYGHFFMDIANDSSKEQIIPAQSLADVNATARLGCKYIEANVAKTSDGVLLAFHGLSGAFGQEVVDINGGYTYKDTQVSSVTYEWILQNIRYRSKYNKYKTTIPTLDEFCACAKSNGMSVMLQYSEESYEVAKKYFGNDFIAYNGRRDTGFSGVIMNYSGASTIESILALCDSVGSPYFHALNTTVFQNFKNEGSLPDLIAAVHRKNCKVGIAASYHTAEDINLFLKLGGDFLASASYVNDFRNGNIIHAVGDVDFSDFTIDDGISIDDGILKMPNGKSISVPYTEQIYLGKGSLRIRFKGSLWIYRFGHSSFNGRIYTHDKIEELWLSTYYLEQMPSLYITSRSDDTEIHSIEFNVSKV